jgi:hypothetical protein
VAGEELRFLTTQHLFMSDQQAIDAGLPDRMNPPGPHWNQQTEHVMKRVPANVP